MKRYGRLILMGILGNMLLGTATGMAAPAGKEQNRAATADMHYASLRGTEQEILAKTDPEFAAMKKKYIYGDIDSQAKITPEMRSLVMLAVLTTNQNERQIKGAVTEALNAGASPLMVREALYHITPYVGFAKTETAILLMDEVFKQRGIALPLPVQGTTSDADRFEKGLKFQTDTYGERITQMRARTPDNQKHLQDNLSAFCFGDIYTRGTLDLKQREMLTVAAIGTLGIEAQFQSHVRGTLAAGATEDEVIGVLTAMNPYVGFPRTLWMLKLANAVFSSQQTKK